MPAGGACGSAPAWDRLPRWTLLLAGFGAGRDFLAAWQAWRDDPGRPALLHVVAVTAQPVSAAALVRPSPGDGSHQAPPLASSLVPLAHELARQWWGLVPGFHRLAFEGGRVLLTLCVGELHKVLPELAFQADAMAVDGLPPAGPEPWLVRGLARLSRRGTTLSAPAAGSLEGSRRLWTEAGFQLQHAGAHLHAVFDPAWQVRGAEPQDPVRPGRCAVVGAGLAGAATAASLARRGWRVTVLDAAPHPAAGASGLPAGLLAPALSPDDNPLSRIARAGTRLTLQALQALQPGGDHGQVGVLEWRGDDARPPPHADPWGAQWCRPATAEECDAAGFAPGSHAWWHAPGAWVRPAALVRHWLAQPGITWLGGCSVDRLHQDGSRWQLLDYAGLALQEADMVVVAAAAGSAALLDGRLRLNTVRGQVTWGALPPGAPLPPTPVNGHGHLLPAVALDGGPAWMAGATYGRGRTDTQVLQADHEANLAKAAQLVPRAAPWLLEASGLQGWAGVRCVAADRRPLVGCLQSGLWTSTALGSRGLTFAALAAELLAARLHGEPLPLPVKLAAALDAGRMDGRTA